jgi:hypothetical protein
LSQRSACLPAVFELCCFEMSANPVLAGGAPSAALFVRRRGLHLKAVWWAGDMGASDSKAVADCCGSRKEAIGNGPSGTPLCPPLMSCAPQWHDCRRVPSLLLTTGNDW